MKEKKKKRSQSANLPCQQNFDCRGISKALIPG